jgi:CelD/BcsL family acetyltransferase involved in cellulose biosynthesis
MKISVVPGRELTADHVTAWSDMQQANPRLESPFFRPEFVQAVAAVRNDVEVAVFKRAGSVVGFFPFQRKYWGIGRPVGDGLNDFQGVICSDTCDFDPQSLLRACRLWSCDLDHLVCSQASWESHHWDRRPSPRIDVSHGLAGCLADRSQKSRRIHESLRKLRKLEREQGRLRFEWHSSAPEAFDALIRWKSDQYRRTRVANVFALGWTVRLLRHVVQHRRLEFSGQLSALWAGERLAAVQFGLRSNHEFHSWFPTYDMALARYSPGMALFLRMIEESPAAGIRQIELGAGPATYKDSLATGSTMVARASVARLKTLGGVSSSWRRAKLWVRSSPLRVPARIIADRTRPLRRWLSMR